MGYNQRQLDEILSGIRRQATIKARFLRPFAGGQPADQKGIEAFVKHHLGIDPDDPDPKHHLDGQDVRKLFDDAVRRIQNEEIGEHPTTPEGGEVETEEIYAINVIRKSALGPFILEHQIKALLKQAASRVGIFAAKGKIGSKGDLAEMGTITATGISLLDSDRPWEIYLINPVTGPASTEFVKISGSVNTPQGKKSIQHHTETSQEGARFEFCIDWPDNKLKEDDMLKVIAAATQIGLGSCLSLGYGRFEVVDMEFKK